MVDFSVKIIQEKLDPEQLGIVTLSSFMSEFFPADVTEATVSSYEIFHYNGLPRSHPDNKVCFSCTVCHL